MKQVFLDVRIITSITVCGYFFFETIPQERARIDYGVCDKNERNDYEGLETSTFIMF